METQERGKCRSVSVRVCARVQVKERDREQVCVCEREREREDLHSLRQAPACVKNPVRNSYFQGIKNSCMPIFGFGFQPSRRQPPTRKKMPMTRRRSGLLSLIPALKVLRSNPGQ